MLEETGQYPYNDTAKAHRGRSFMSEVIALLAGGILGWVLLTTVCLFAAYLLESRYPPPGEGEGEDG